MRMQPRLFASVRPRIRSGWAVSSSERKKLGKLFDKPGVAFAPPPDPDTVSHEMTIRVPDCRATYDALSTRGARFLTPPVEYEREVRCFFRDPDGHLLEISESRAAS